ncbi:Lysophospholipase L1 [Micromonospora coriariae]|uniref:Lysophospholipase L1 n=1 Tax=Micromonospora coriariae TaxID=285665 RepID=A0A1C4Y2R2_9ACTN|nr:SGNH/GDSL hydrolase family protein [Micromonospora coriariae]SCF14998.1 Lysophospholipase L1 [Micromonospora coriariae]
MWHRYVAIGDSTTEGLDDPDGAGGYRGWADRFALAVARAQGGLEYANLAIRGRTTARIRAEQLQPALDLAPDLATVVAGMNDVLRPSFDADQVAEDVAAMQRALVGQGATVLTFTMPDPAPVMPLARPLRGRMLALNEALRAATARTGATLLDLGVHPVSSDPRLERRPAARQQRRARADRRRAGVHGGSARVRRLMDAAAAAAAPASAGRGVRRRAGVDPTASAALAGPAPARAVVGRRPGREAAGPAAGAGGLASVRGRQFLHSGAKGLGESRHGLSAWRKPRFRRSPRQRRSRGCCGGSSTSDGGGGSFGPRPYRTTQSAMTATMTTTRKKHAMPPVMPISRNYRVAHSGDPVSRTYVVTPATRA